MKLPGISKIENSASARIRLISIIVVVVILLTLPMWIRVVAPGNMSYIIFIITLMGIYITLGHMWNLLAGYSGLVSLGLQMYIGVGAFTVAAFSNYLGVPLIIALFLGGIVSTIIAVGLSYLLLRMRGMYFAIATWMFAEAMVLVIVSQEFFGRGQGLFIIAARALNETHKYYLSVILVIAVTFLVVLQLRSKLGLGLLAIRDNDTAAQTTGVPLFRSKLVAMMISGFVTGIVGGVYYIVFIWIQPYSAFSITTWTVAAVFIVVIGGIGTIMGPIVGGVIYVFLSQYLSTLTWMGSLNMVILGAIAVTVILVAPHGIVGTTQRRFGFEIISARRWMWKYTDRLQDPVPD